MLENQPEQEISSLGGEIRLPDAPVLVVTGDRTVWLSSDGEINEESIEVARIKVNQAPVLLVHRLSVARKLGINPFTAFDVLELFAFTYPARHCLPTPRGIAKALRLQITDTAEDQALTLYEAITQMLGHLSKLPADEKKQASRIAMSMGRSGWNWGISLSVVAL